MSRFWPSLAVFCALTALGAAYSIWWAARGESGGHLAMIVGLAFGLPILVVALLVAFRLSPANGRLERTRSALLTLLAAVTCVGALQVPGCIAAGSVREAQCEDAKRWCERLASKVEQLRRDQGDYPAELEGSELVADAPELCDPRWLYRRNEDGTFELSFYTNVGFDSIWTYRSRDRSWTHTN